MGCTASAQTGSENQYSVSPPAGHDEKQTHNSKPSTPGGSNSNVSRGSGKGGSSKGSGKAGDLRRSVTETKINQALLKRKMEQAVADKPITFEKILLKFDKLRTVTTFIKEIFNEVAVNGHLDHNGLETLMKRLGVNMQLDEMLDLFDFINVQEQKTISIKEFLVALTIGMVLDAIPALGEPHATAPGTASNPAVESDKKTVAKFHGHQHEVKDMLGLIVSAYLLFDPVGKGYIERKGMEATLQEHGDKGSKSNHLLSQQRWAEMDWDANGTIDFAEFVFSFTSWANIDEEE